MIDASKTNRLTALPTTVLFADIVDSIDLFARLGNQPAKDLIDEFFEQLKLLVIDHHGTIIKRIGDELMCSFDQPLAAFAAARDMQRLADTLNGTRPEQVKLRIGFHFGNVIRAGDDLFGDTVNIAARVAAVASSGRILTTGQTVGMVPAYDAGLVRPWRRELLKGLAEPVELHEVLWTEDTQDSGFSNTTLGSYQAPSLHQLVMRLQDRSYVVDAQHPLLTLGRHPSNHVVVEDAAAFVSSHHAKIECRGGVFVVTDTSLNGTYVALGGSDYFRVKLPFTLESSGQIVIGYPPNHPHQITARFELL